MATPAGGDSRDLPNEVFDIINFVAIYYEKGASGNAFLRKEKFRAQISRQVKTLESFERNCQVCLLFKSCLHLTF